MTVLVFSIAQNGYAYTYRPCLRSQRRYCRSRGYAHVAVTRPLRVPDPALSAWLKVPLLLAALEGGYELAMFVDADCRIRPGAPGLEGLAPSPPDGIRMSLGRSGRVNSGVIVASRGPEALRFLRAAMASMTEEIPSEDRARLRFENGNLIYCAREVGGVASLDRRWNNTEDPSLDDHIRHYTGPMRAEYRAPPLAGRVTAAIGRTIHGPGEQPGARSAAFRAELAELTRRSIARYPRLVDPAAR